MKHILILTHSFPPKNIVGALRPFRLAKHIGRVGWKCTVITRQPDKRSSLDFSLIQELSPGTKIKYLYTSDGIRCDYSKFFEKNIGNIITRSEKKRSLNSRYMNSIRGNALNILDRYILTPDLDILHVPVIIKNVYELIDHRNDNIIFTTSPSHSIHLAGYFLSKRGFPWVADFRDPWDHYPLKGHHDLTNPIERWMETNVVQQADAVISTTQTNTKNLIRKHHGVDRKKFHTVTNSYDESKFNVDVYNDPEKFVISYTGIFYTEKDPFTFFRALRTWFDSLNKKEKETYENTLQIQLIGSRTQAVVKVINNLNLNHVIRFIDRVPHEEAIRLTKASDLVLVSSGIGEKSRPGWLLSKLFEYLGCRIPILAVCREGEMAQIIRETKSGYVITSEDHTSIHSILANEIEKKIAGKTNTEFLFDGVERFEEKQTMSEMFQIIKSVSKKTN